jgi:NADPH-dependent F420 reductase
VAVQVRQREARLPQAAAPRRDNATASGKAEKIETHTEESNVKIAVIGTGNVGGTLGRRWAQGGHTVTFVSRDPGSEKVQALLKASGPNARTAELKEAVAVADVVLLAMPWHVARDTIEGAGNLSDKIVVDATNPMAPNMGLALGFTTSGGETVAGWAKGARVVKAFNSTGSGNMADTNYGDQRPSMFICGDDAAAKKIVGELTEELGFEAIDAGPLTLARALEPLTVLWIQLAYRQGLGPNVAFKLLRR